VDSQAMTREEYTAMYEQEERHWWYVGMRKIVAALLDGIPSAGKLRILDAGCGTGFMLGWLRKRYPGSTIMGMDASPIALAYCRERGEGRLIQGSVARVPFREGSFDLITSFDVLQSFTLEGASQAIEELIRALKPGGTLFLRAPAFQWLYSAHDRAVATQHRFTSKELEEILTRLGAKLERVTYANTFLFPVAALWRRARRAEGPSARSDVRPLPKPVRFLNGPMAALLGAESLWLGKLRGSFPLGLSAIVVARKPLA
jgi:SAM-dependent methyltransferase